MPARKKHVTPEQQIEVDTALLAYWTARDEARLQQEARGVVDQGARSGVTSGGHLDRVAQLLARVAVAAGAPRGSVYYKAPKDDPARRQRMQEGCTLPGYYRPTKDWDVVVYSAAGNPIVAVELKSQNGPSYGNNANNRAEEAIGNAVDLHRAVQEGLLGTKPWTAYVYVIEDDIVSSTVGGRKKSGFLARDAAFRAWSYQTRVRELCDRLTVDDLYNEAWAVATSRPSCADAAGTPPDKLKCPMRKAGVAPRDDTHAFSWKELDPERHGYSQIVAGLTATISKHYPSTEARRPTPAADLAWSTTSADPREPKTMTPSCAALGEVYNEEMLDLRP